VAALRPVRLPAQARGQAARDRYRRADEDLPPWIADARSRLIDRANAAEFERRLPVLTRVMEPYLKASR
jgi:hypothetical protein